VSDPNLDRIVNATISATTKVPTVEGFDTPLIAAYHAHYADRVRPYDDEDGMIADGFNLEEPALLVARAMFAQGISPVKIGRRAAPWIQLVDLTPAAVTPGLVYSITIAGTLVQYTALGGDDLNAVCTALTSAIGLVAALAADPDAIITNGVSTAGAQTYTGAQLNGVIGGNAVVPGRYASITFNNHVDWDATVGILTSIDPNGNQQTENFNIPNGGNATVNLTKKFQRIVSLAIPAQSGVGGTFTLGVRARATAANVGGTKVRVTAAFGADLIPYAHRSATSNLSLFDATADSGIAADLAQILVADRDWYGLALDSNGAAEIEAAAAWAESQTHVQFVAQTPDTAVSDTTSVADVTSVGAYLKSHTYYRSVPWFHPNIGTDFLAAAILASSLQETPGSATLAYKTLAGVSAYPLTSAQEANLRAKNVNRYVTIARIDSTLDGVTAAGEWADVIRFRDWQISDIQLSVFATFANNRKVPFTNPGAEIVSGAVRASLARGVAATGLSATPKPTVTAPDVETLDATVRQTRRLPNVKFSARLAGAIQAVDIRGEVTA
jgi:hypothetical protein